MHDLINAWRRFDGTKAPHLLDEDRDALTRHGHSRSYGSWENYIGSQDFLLSSPDLHLDLLPVPYVGDLAKASIFLLLLNPGLSPVDYYGEYKVGSFRRTLLQTLHQAPDCDFWCLDPQFAWSGAFSWWQSKLHGTIGALATRLEIPYAEAHGFVRSNIAALELFPYHSRTFSVPNSVLRDLASVQLIRRYVHEELVPRADAREIRVIVTRNGGGWGLDDDSNAIVYKGAQTRGAHLSPNSVGGAAMLEFLHRRYQG